MQQCYNQGASLQSALSLQSKLSVGCLKVQSNLAENFALFYILQGALINLLVCLFNAVTERLCKCILFSLQMSGLILPLIWVTSYHLLI